jgi:phage anti-repressor protein
MDTQMASIIPMQELFVNTDDFAKILCDTFTSDDEKLFMMNFKQYIVNDPDVKIISLDDIWDWMGFSSKSNAKRALVGFFDDQSYDVQLSDKSGKKLETITMSIDTFKKFCIKANTKRSNEVCDYYIKMERAVNKHMCNMLAKQMQVADENRSRIDFERHKVLAKAHANKPVVYIMKVMVLPDGSGIIIKIGHTNQAQDRASKISYEFGVKVTLLEVYECEMNVEFERFLHNHRFMENRRYSDDKIKSIECYKMKHDAEIDQVKRIINNNMPNYKSRDSCQSEKYQEMKRMEHEQRIMDFREKEMEHEKSLLKHVKTSEDFHQFTSLVLNSKTQMSAPPVLPEENEPPPPEPLQPPKEKLTNINKCAPQIQMYDPKDLTKVARIFQSVTETCRIIEGAAYTSIKNAARYKTVYLGYRWHLINRDDPTDPMQARDIGPTKEKTERRVGAIAQMTPDLGTIVAVYALQKAAGAAVGQTDTAICTAIKHDKVVAGHRWMLFEDVPADLADAWLDANELPEPPANIRSRRVQKIDHATGQVLHTYDCQADVQTKYKMSPKTLKTYAESGRPYKGFRWCMVAAPE